MTLDYRAVGTRRPHDPNQDIVWSHGAGCWLWDIAGKKYLDCVSGYSANVLGHCHPDLVAAINDQTTKLAFTTGGESILRSLLEEKVCQAVSQSQAKCLQAGHPRKPFKAWISTTGARAIEIAWRMAFQYRPGGLVTFDLGYHGRSIATSYISDTTQQDCLLIGSSQTVRFEIPFPRIEAGSNRSLQDACHESIEAFRKLMQTHSGGISALLIEPAIGSRGYYFAPPEYFQRLVEIAREHELLIISDEVQMGLGRLGAMIASHSQGWCPDLLVLGKALGGGLLPISCVVGTTDIMDQLRTGYESETFAGSPLACRIAIEVLQILASTDLIAKSSLLHAELRNVLTSILPRDSVSGVGSATVIDCRSATKNSLNSIAQEEDSYVAELGRKAAYKCSGLLRENGILVHVTGSQRDRIALIPPLNISPDEIQEMGLAFTKAWPEAAVA